MAKKQKASAKEKVSPQQILDYWSKYYWFEHYRCCDQEYEVEDDIWTESDLADLKQRLLDRSEPFHWDVPLYLEHREVGTFKMDLHAVFDVLSHTRSYTRPAPDGTDRRLTDEEVAAPLSTADVNMLVESVAKMLDEAIYEMDLPSRLHGEAEFVVPAVNAGAAATLNLLREHCSIDVLRSRRLLRAIEAIGWANAFQAEYKSSTDDWWKRRFDEEDPQKLVPVGADTKAVVKAIGKLVERGYGRCRRSPGRPRLVDRTKMPRELRTTREALRPLHVRLKRLHSAGARSRIRTEFPDLTTRLERAGVLTDWINGSCPSLEDAAAALLAREMGVSASTVKRYGRTKVKKLKQGILHQ